MTTCHDAREQFSALVDEALDARGRAALDAHLAGCAECRRELEGFRRTVALVRAIEPARAPAGFVDRVRAAVGPEPWSRRVARRLFQPWPVKLPLEAAAVLIVGVLAVWLFQRLPEQQQAVRSEAPTATYRQEPAPAPPPPAASETGSVRPTARAARPVAPQPPTEERFAAPSKPATPSPAQAPADKRETPSTDALAPAPLREEARGRIGREGLRDLPAPAAPTVPAPAARAPEPGRQGFVAQGELEGAKLQKEAAALAETKRAQAQQAAKERDKEAAGEIFQGLTPSQPPSQVAGRLATTDRERAERELQTLVTKHGGTTVWRRGDARVTLVDVEVPRDKYARFVLDLARLGRWTIERETRELPETVRVQIQFE